MNCVRDKFKLQSKSNCDVFLINFKNRDFDTLKIMFSLDYGQPHNVMSEVMTVL